MCPVADGGGSGYLKYFGGGMLLGTEILTMISFIVPPYSILGTKNR